MEQLVTSEERTETTTPPLTPEEGRLLLEAARDSIEATVTGRERRPLPEVTTPRLDAAGAAFVTVRDGTSELRGCIGTTRFERPLLSIIPDLAAAAATEDRRFDPIEPRELEGMKISISVLTPLEPAKLDAIVIGKHGLVVRKGHASGLLLPQVASERGWDARTFLRETSRKAGLSPDAWRDPEARVFWFTAEIVGEPGAID